MGRAHLGLSLAGRVQYAEESQWNDLDIIVYPGADATFTLYEDEGDNYNYEKGQYSTITFTWNNAKRQLTIGQRQGSFKDMLKERKFNVRIVGTEGTQTVAYNGQEMTL